MSNILNLIERVEKASGPDRGLDEAIWLAVTPGSSAFTTEVPATEQRKGWTIREQRDANNWLVIVPHYSASLDAVMALKQDGHTFALGDCNEDSVPWACVTSTFGTDYAATGSDVILAALAAILKSRLATNGGGDCHE